MALPTNLFNAPKTFWNLIDMIFHKTIPENAVTVIQNSMYANVEELNVYCDGEEDFSIRLKFSHEAETKVIQAGRILDNRDYRWFDGEMTETEMFDGCLTFSLSTKREINLKNIKCILKHIVGFFEIQKIILTSDANVMDIFTFETRQKLLKVILSNQELSPYDARYMLEDSNINVLILENVKVKTNGSPSTYTVKPDRVVLKNAPWFSCDSLHKISCTSFELDLDNTSDNIPELCHLSHFIYSWGEGKLSTLDRMKLVLPVEFFKKNSDYADNIIGRLEDDDSFSFVKVKTTDDRKKCTFYGKNHQMKEGELTFGDRIFNDRTFLFRLTGYML
ncbi:hypothetical protein CRE_31281 [Caenorhabditis remanei]|uniref:Uncharacterized protein n=1 Tax=Caenorhabditis remanei TaxID=31234 RepID=E3MLM3_CAERE|nr:hypothetical protein CRE_31281 [Caenorhabditis remanei]